MMALIYLNEKSRIPQRLPPVKTFQKSLIKTQDGNERLSSKKSKYLNHKIHMGHVICIFYIQYSHAIVLLFLKIFLKDMLFKRSEGVLTYASFWLYNQLNNIPQTAHSLCGHWNLPPSFALSSSYSFMYILCWKVAYQEFPQLWGRVYFIYFNKERMLFTWLQQDVKPQPLKL